MADSINYGAHAPADSVPSAGSIDYGAHAPAAPPSLTSRALDAAGDFAGGVASKLNPVNMVKGAMDTLDQIRTQPLSVAKEIFLHPYMAISRGVDALKAGKTEEALAHFSAAQAPPGSGLEESMVKAATPGQRATGFGEMLGTGLAAYGGAKLPEAVPVVKSAAKTAVDLAKTPGASTMLGGAGEVLVGAGQLPHSLPVGAGIIMRGAGDAYKGFGKFKAARAAAAEAAAKEATPPPIPNIGPDPLGTVTNASTLDPAATSPTSAPLPNAAQYATGTLPQPVQPPNTMPVPAQPVPLQQPPIAEPPNTMPVAPQAAPGAAMTEPQGATNAKVDLTPKESAAIEITRRNTKAANDVKAQYFSDNGYTGDQLKAGDEYKALIDKIDNPNSKTGKFNTKSAYDPEHVKTVADLVDAKNVIRDKATELQGKGVTADTLKPSDVQGMNPEEAARVQFRLRNLAKPGAMKAAQDLADALKKP